MKRHVRRPDVLPSFKTALPRSLNWLGTVLLTHHTVLVVVSGMLRFGHLRYLNGQAVFAKSWTSRSLHCQVKSTDLMPSLWLARQARCDCAWTCAKAGTAEYFTALGQLNELCRMLVDVSAGVLQQNSNGRPELRKYWRDAMSTLALEWMEQLRSGITHSRDTHPSRTRECVAKYAAVTCG